MNAVKPGYSLLKKVTMMISKVTNGNSSGGMRMSSAYKRAVPWKAPTISELPIPQGSWDVNFKKMNRKNNRHLITGVSFFGITLITLFQSGLVTLNCFIPNLEDSYGAIGCVPRPKPKYQTPGSPNQLEPSPLSKARGRPALPLRSVCTSSRCLSGQSGDSGDGDKNSKAHLDKQSEKKPKEKASIRLNDLLKSIVKDQDARALNASKTADDSGINLKLAKPIRQKSPPPTQEEVKAALDDKEVGKEIGKEMLTAVKTVAQSVEGDSKAIESELVQKLKSHTPGKVNMSTIFDGMKIDKVRKDEGPPKPNQEADLSRAHRVRRVFEEQGNAPRGGSRDRARPQEMDDRRRPPFSDRPRRTVDQSRVSYAPVDLFGAQPLGIFTSQRPTSTVGSSNLKTWDKLFEKDLKSAVSHPPANGFEEMILWTEQSKLWHYPINNEQGLDQEAKVSFNEHVFLEPHIDGWCPTRGPIRHFMELVCIGLSKNPYLTVQEKKDHIEWYHGYFMGKADIIKEVGAGEIK